MFAKIVINTINNKMTECVYFSSMQVLVASDTVFVVFQLMPQGVANPLLGQILEDDNFNNTNSKCKSIGTPNTINFPFSPN